MAAHLSEAAVTTKKRTVKSADAVILDVLGYEFDFDDRADAERKIRRRLRYYGLRPCRQERVALLRRFKDAIQSEIGRGRQSRYFIGGRGKYAALEDFDLQRMIWDLTESYPDLPQREIAAFVPFAVYLYYLR